MKRGYKQVIVLAACYFKLITEITRIFFFKVYMKSINGNICRSYLVYLIDFMIAN